LPFRTNKYTRQINALSLRWRAVPNPDRGDVIEAAAGERIVAFARPGKPPGFPVLMADWARSRLANTQGIQHLATVSKARWGRD
jgi:hypothetical protein